MRRNQHKIDQNITHENTQHVCKANKELWIRDDKLLRIKYSNFLGELIGCKNNSNGVSGGGAVHFLEEKDFSHGVHSFLLCHLMVFTSALLIFPLHIQLTHSLFYLSLSPPFNPSSSTSSLHFRFLLIK